MLTLDPGLLATSLVGQSREGREGRSRSDTDLRREEELYSTIGPDGKGLRNLLEDYIYCL